MDKKIKNESIEYILSQGLVKPQSVKDRIGEMLRNMSFRFIFWDTGYTLLFAAITLAVVLVLFYFTPDDYSRSAAVAVAPIFFLLITMFAETSERLGEIYELKQTCRYTIRQITALRVICYSMAGFIFTTVIATVSSNSLYEFISLFPLCLSALFICAILNISLMRLLHGKWIIAMFSALWILVNILIPFSLQERWEIILLEIPIVFSAALAVTSGAVFVYQITKMLSEVKRHAVTQ